MGQPRFIAIELQVGGVDKGAAEVKGLSNAFDQVDKSANKAASGGMREYTDASIIVRREGRWTSDAAVAAKELDQATSKTASGGVRKLSNAFTQLDQDGSKAAGGGVKKLTNAFTQLDQAEAKTSGGGVKALPNAFNQIDQSASRAAGGGMRNAFNASSLLRAEMVALGSRIPVVGTLFSGLTSDLIRYVAAARQTSQVNGPMKQAFGAFQKTISDAFRGKNDDVSILFRHIGIDLEKAVSKPLPAFKTFLAHLHQIPDAGDRAAFATNIFGSQTAKLLPVLEGVAAEEAAVVAQTAGMGGGMMAALGPIALVVAAVALLTAGLIIGGKAAFDLTKLAAEAGSEIHTVTQKVSFSAETISGLGVAAKTSGSDLGTLTNALGTFDKNLQRARESDTKLAKQFRDHNVDIRNNETALRGMFRALAALPAGEKQVELAMLAFGEVGKDVLAIVKDTNGNIDLAIAKYQKMGLVISSEAAKAADEFTDQLTILEFQIKMVGVTIGRELMPHFLRLIKYLSDLVTHNGPRLKAWTVDVVRYMENVASGANLAASALRELISIGTFGFSEEPAIVKYFLEPIYDELLKFAQGPVGEVIRLLHDLGEAQRKLAGPDLSEIASVGGLQDKYMALFPKLPGSATTGGADTIEKIGEALKKAQLDVQHFGQNTHLDQFNRAAAEMGDQLKKLNYEEINRANTLLAQWRTEAIKLDQLEAAKRAREEQAAATKKANDEAVQQAQKLTQANETFAGSLDALKQRHAELTATQSIARSELQKFEEALKKGAHKDIKPELIEQMRSALKAFDADVADINRQKQLEQFGDRIRSLREVIQGFTVEGESNLRRVRKSLIDLFEIDPTKLDAFIDRLKGGAELSGPEGLFEAFRGLFSPDSLAKLSALNQNTAEFVGWLRKARQADLDLAAVETPLAQAKEDYNRLLAEEADLRDPVLMQQRFANELLREHIDLQLRDFDASLDLARAQREIADASVYSATQANASVAKFLAQQKNITEIVADAKVGVISTTFDLIDRALDRWTDKLGAVGGLIKQIISDFIRLALVPAFARMFGLSGGGGAGIQTGGSQQAAGGGIFGNIFRGIFGGGGSGAGMQTAGGSQQAAGAMPIAGTPWSLIGSALGMGGGITAPASLSSQVANQAALHQAAHAAGLGSATAAGGAIGGAGSLKSSIGAMLPFLGLSIGMGAGGQSRFGQGLGAAGGLLAGGIGAAFLTPGLFAAGGIFGSMGPAIAGLLTNPFTAVAAGALIIGALIFGKNKQRRADETQREQISQDTITALNQLLAQARNMDLGQATAAFEQIRVNYFNGVNQMKDSKTKRIATDWWYKPEHPPQVTWAKVKDAVAAGQRARDIEKNLIPEFSMGGTVPFRTGLFSMATGMTPIKVRPGEAIFAPGASFGAIVPGVDRGYDSVLTAARPGTRVVPRAQVSRAPGYQFGGVHGGGQGGGTTVVIEELNLEVDLEIGKDDASKIVVTGVRTSDGGNAVVGRVNTYMRNGN